MSLWNVQGERWVSGHTRPHKKCQFTCGAPEDAQKGSTTEFEPMNSVYQQYLYKNLSERYASQNMQLDKIVNDANAEIESLQVKLGSKQISAVGKVIV
jgi:hypothetical protein